jgi:hypothetical protein
MDNLELTLTNSTVEALELFSQITKKDYNTMINEALEMYFDQIRKNMLEEDWTKEKARTKLDYNKFGEEGERQKKDRGNIRSFLIYFFAFC